MLDNQVIYDCFNASLDSKPFKVYTCVLLRVS